MLMTGGDIYLEVQMSVLLWAFVLEFPQLVVSEARGEK